jgi:5'-nucleotidase
MSTTGGASKGLTICVVFLAASTIGLIVALAVVASTKKTETQQADVNADGALNINNCPGLFKKSNDIVQITILQLNDIYEIDAVSHGTEGGLARVATFRKQLLAQNPRTITMLAGDIISPSALGTAAVVNTSINPWAFSTPKLPGAIKVKNDTTLGGIQTVDVLNYMGLDFAAIGNHEFDNKERVFRRRLVDSKFTWINCNAFNTTTIIDMGIDNIEKTNSTRPFNGVMPSVIVPIFNSTLKMGITGGMIDPGQSMARVLNATATIAAISHQIDLLIAGGANIIVCLMHQALADDVNLALLEPRIDIIVGGHEHDNYYLFRGYRETPIYRADANARTVYVHDLFYNTTDHTMKIQSRLQHITDGFDPDPEVAARTAFWTDAAFAGFASSGFNARETIANLPISYNVLDVNVRGVIMPIGSFVADAMLNYPNVTVTGAQLALFNGGAFRFDDNLQAGLITQYDVLRMLPFLDILQVFNISAQNLINALDAGFAAVGNGGFVQYSSNVVKLGTSSYKVNGLPVNGASSDLYTVCSIDFLWNTGTGAVPVGNPTNLNSTKIDLGFTNCGDQRMAAIEWFRQKYPLS